MLSHQGKNHSFIVDSHNEKLMPYSIEYKETQIPKQI